MPNKDPRKSRARTYKSVFFTSSFIVALCTALVTASLAVMSYNTSRKFADNGVRQRAEEVTTLIAKQSGGALKFGKITVFEGLFGDAIRGSDRAASAGTVFRADGEVLSTHGDVTVFGDALDVLVTRALETGETVLSEDGFTAVVPVRFGKDEVIVGAVAMRWTSEVLKEQHFKEQLFSLFVSGMLGLAGLAGAAFFLRMHVSRPLVRLRDAMDKVAAEEFNATVPGVHRGDEVGEIARTLETFRDALRVADETSRDSIFKGAAFEGSTAAMMMIDMGFHIQYLNNACRDLLFDFRDYFQSIDASFDPAKLVGSSIGSFVDPDGMLKKVVSNTSAMPYHADIAADDRRIRLTVSAVSDVAGEQIGCVLELRDVTADRLNQAAITSIDVHQVRLDLSVEGKLLSANANFTDALDVPAHDLKGRAVDELLRWQQDEGRSSLDLIALRQGETISGRFAAKGKVRDLIVEGNFNLVQDAVGRPLRIVFIGGDVTDAQAAIEAAEEHRAAMEKAQAQVVSALSHALDKLAAGDLTGRIEQKFAPEYEALRGNFNTAISGLSDAIKHVVDSSDMISSESAGISSSADYLALRTEKQAATLEETAAAIDELTASVTSAASSANRASEMANSAMLSAEKSGDVVRETVAAMGEIERNSSGVSKIIKVIEDIAFQTNLLALNAGVEAARAGDSGRGFAVVATEVRALAQRSSDAARQINALISTSVSQVGHGVVLVDQMGGALCDIVGLVSEITTQVASIAASVQEQSGSLKEINTAIAELDQFAQKNSTMFEQTTAASHVLKSQAQSLADATSLFRVGDAEQVESARHHSRNQSGPVLLSA